LQGRLTARNEPFEIPLVKGWKIFSDAAVRVSGLAGRARFSMSRASGKVEILGVDSGKFIFATTAANTPRTARSFSPASVTTTPTGSSNFARS